MRARISRHLGSTLDAIDTPRTRTRPAAVAALGEARPPADAPPAEFNWRDYTAMLLHTAAEIEHSLMVQYLFAAYSLGGPQVPAALAADVRSWQEVILGIAKEEMGHFVSVQNLLTGFGAPRNLNREDYPWGSEFYPFGFSLERLTLDSLAKYVVAESPPHWRGHEADAIRRRAGGGVNRVGVLYEKLIKVIGAPTRVPDSAFRSRSVVFQASWDEWGRGYRQGERGAGQTGVPGVPAPDLLILETWSRTTAVRTLKEVGEQGEALGSVSGTNPVDAREKSHFHRFLLIYQAMSRLEPHDLGLVTRPLAPNPSTFAGDPYEVANDPATELWSQITEPQALLWAHLFNLRYRILLLNLAHAFELADAPGTNGAGTPRGGLVNRTFAEMYNLRAIAGMLVELPLAPGAEQHAGPPFQMPYTLSLPGHEPDRWSRHLDLIDAAAALIGELYPGATPAGRGYLTALRDADAGVRRQVEVLAGGAARPPTAGVPR